jgi:glyoxylase-like metal-dependent hydrolase (beta-lactamase superfamily II)
VQLNQISDHIYWLPPDPTTDRPVLGAIAGVQATLMVDAGNSAAHVQLFFSQLTSAKVALPHFVVLTHWHWDHVFGSPALNLPTLAHRETKRRLDLMAGWDWSDEALDRRVAEGVEIEFCRDMLKLELPDPATRVLRRPEISFSEQVELDLGGLTTQIVHVGGDHAADSVVVYVPQEKIIFLSDCLYFNLYHNPPTYTTGKLFPLIDRLLQFEADFYLLGHNPEPLSRAEMISYCNFLKIVGNKVVELGPQRELILAKLAKIVSEPEEDVIETVDAFLTGMYYNC